MICSYWETREYPILINPEFWELGELFLEKWDTIRICVDGKNIGLASGYGNTHSSITSMMRVKLNNRRLLPDTYILFRQDGDFFFNLEDIGGGRKVHYRKVLKEWFEEDHARILQDIVTARS